MGWIRTTRIFLISSVAGLLILAAVIFSVLRALLPHASGYIHDIEQAINQQVGLPVSIGSLDADMHWFTPRLKVLDLTIYRENGEDVLIAFSEANFSLALFDSIRRMRLTPGMIHLHGADLLIERHTDTHWVVQGYHIRLDESKADSDEITELVLNTDLALIDSTVRWRDYSGNSRNMEFENSTVVIDNAFDTHVIELDLNLPEYLGNTLRIIAEVSGELDDPAAWQGKVYMRGERMLLHNWLAVSRLKQYVKGSGVIDAELWGTWSERRLAYLSGTVDGESIELLNRDDSALSWQAKQLSGGFFLRDLNEGWRLDVRDLVVQGREDWREPADIVVSHHGDDWRVMANYFKPDDLLPLIDVLPRDTVDLRLPDLKPYALSGEFFNVDVIISEGEIPDIDLSGAFTNLSLCLPERNPCVSGLDGRLSWRDDSARLELVSFDVGLEPGDLFREPLSIAHLEGAVVIERQPGGVSVMSDALHAANTDIETVSRLRIDVREGRSPFLDIHSTFINAVATSTYKYVPVAIMSDKLVAWLDNAFRGGTVSRGDFLFHGSGADFPFHNGQGVMQVQFDVKDGTLNFLDSWPEVHNLSASVRFHNASLRITDARARESNNVAVTASARIDDLMKARVMIDADINAPADEIQQYIWNSPLNKKLGRAVEQFQAVGDTRLRLGLDIPLSSVYGNTETALEGSIQFNNSKLYVTGMDYMLDQLDGRLAFDRNSIQGDDIRARFGGEPVSIRVVSEDDPESPRTVFSLEGRLKADTLLGALPFDLSHYASGKSHFNVTLSVPRKKTDYDAVLDVASSLSGIAFDFSGGISKSRDEVLHTALKYSFYDNVRSLHLNAGDDIDLLARLDEAGFWKVTVDAPLIKGSGRLHKNLDTSTTVRFELDHMQLSAFVPEHRAPVDMSKLKAADFPSLHLQVKKLTWKKALLKNVMLVADHHPRGLVFSEIEVKDPAVTVTGKGSWMRRSWQLREETNISLKIQAAQVGDMLDQLGFSRYVDKATHTATMDWLWPGAPYGFSWENVTGSTSIYIGNGEITDIDPGAGRILGLFNVLHLPKRLGLNFEELYRKGFVFDSIQGDYTFSEGEAVTQNTEIKGSSADMTMMGRIGIANEDYDLVIMVKPHTAAATFAGGTLAAGPTVGLGLVLLQELLGVELLGRDVYTVKGSWNEPKIEKIASGGDEPTDDFAE